MPKESMGGNKKRKRRPRPQHKILAQEKRKEKWLRHLKRDSKAQHKRKRAQYTLNIEKDAECRVRPVTFEDMYRSYRVTKGRQGLNPNPTTRQKENPWVLHDHWCGRFPITELMEKPIRYSKPE